MLFKQTEYSAKMNLATISALICMVLFSAISLAQGTRLTDTTVLNASVNSDTVNVLSGNHGLVSTGSVNLENTQISDSVIVNQSINIGAITIARGNRTVAATGSIIIRNKQLTQVKLINATNNAGAVAVADQSSKALIGSIQIAQ